MTFCSKCAKEIPEGGHYCVNCGQETNQNIPTKPSDKKEESWAWIFLPVLFGFVGGTIVYFAIKYDHPKQANQHMVLGIIMTVIAIVAIMMLIPSRF